jgi:hypothetical protein
VRIVRNRRWWWVYLDPECDLEAQIIWEVFNKDACDRIVTDWFRGNLEGGWRYTNTIVKLKGDSRDFTAFRFEHEQDAILFKVRFEGFRLT